MGLVLEQWESIIIQVSIVMKQHPRIFFFFLIPESATLKLGAMFRYFIVTFLVLRQHCLTDCHRNLDLFGFLFLPPHDFAPSSPTRNLRYSISISITAKIILKYDWFKKEKEHYMQFKQNQCKSLEIVWLGSCFAQWIGVYFTTGQPVRFFFSLSKQK